MYSVAVVGAGPAGVMTAVQLMRYGVNCCIFEMNQPGGLIREACHVQNLLGFPDGINGERVADLLADHLKRWHIPVIDKQVVSIDSHDDACDLTCKDGTVYKAGKVVCATGTKPRLLPRVSEQLVDTKESLYIFYSPLVLEKTVPIGKKILVYGGGDVALDYALRLQHSYHVCIACRGEMKAISVLQREIQNYDIPVFLHNEIIQVTKQNQQALVSLSHDNVICDALLVAIGRDKNLEIISNDMNNNIYVIGTASSHVWERHVLISAAAGLQIAGKIVRDSEITE